jgi:hypothetical protein
MCVNAEDGAFRIGDQLDLGLIRMIYERADHEEEHLANPTFGFGSIVQRRNDAIPSRLGTESREFSGLLLMGNLARIRVYRSNSTSTPSVL